MANITGECTAKGRGDLLGSSTLAPAAQAKIRRTEPDVKATEPGLNALERVYNDPAKAKVLRDLYRRCPRVTTGEIVETVQALFGPEDPEEISEWACELGFLITCEPQGGDDDQP